MNHAEPLSADALRWQCDPAQFDFETSDDLPEMDAIIGQERAVEAIEFGIGIRGRGYNLFAHGPTGTGKYEIVRHFLKRQAADQERPQDLCYVQNFEKEREPQKLLVPAGRGADLSEDIESLVEDLKASVPAAFESEDYQVRRSAIDEEFQGKQEEALAEITEEAEERGIRILQTPGGIAFAPLKDDEVIGPENSDELSDEELEEAQEVIDELEEKLRKELRNAPRWERKRREKLKALREEVAGYVVAGPFAELRETYEDLPPVNEYLHDAEADVIENIEYFILAQRVEHAHIVSLGAEDTALSMGEADAQGGQGGGGGQSGGVGGGAKAGQQRREISFRRYNVNVLVDNSELDGAPVVYEDDPTLDRLLGKIEHLAQFGALVTDFNLIQPGALHRANGGYLIIDARKLLMHPLSYEQLKRALYSGQVHIESAKQVMGMAHTVTLEPEPVDLDVKVVLLGERELYYKLDEADHEFGELFKVAADFNEKMPREDNLDQFTRLIAGFARHDECAPLSPAAMSQLIERAARLAGERDKLSTHSESLRDLIRESSYLAGKDDHDIVGPEHIKQAIAAQERRADRIRERLQEQIERRTLMIDTEGDVVGQVNGLSVLSIGDFAFGRPHRLTASARVGKGELVDIEREANLGGPLHSKGVLILAGFLGSRFGKMQPLSLTASLVFEQTYGGIEGDSASLGEVCALLSELAEAPIRQDLAITGSVNQQGRVQAIGGAAEKIEGFYDICKQRGLSGDQGVLIPDSNVRHLMVREDIVEAVEAGDFHVYTVKTVDQAMQLLTGVEAGERDKDGEYPDATINGQVARTLDHFAERARRFEQGRRD